MIRRAFALVFTVLVAVSAYAAPKGESAPVAAPRITRDRLERFRSCDPEVQRLELDKLQKSLEAIGARKSDAKVERLGRKLQRKIEKAARKCGFRSDAELRAFRTRYEAGVRKLPVTPVLSPDEQAALRQGPPPAATQ